MRKLFVLIYVLLCLAFANTYAKNSNTSLKVGVTEFSYPFCRIISENNAEGFSIDLIKSISKKLNFELKYVPCSYVKSIELLEKGEIDLILFYIPRMISDSVIYRSAAYITPKRDIITRKGDEIHKIDQLKEKQYYIKKGSETYFDIMQNDDIPTENMILVNSMRSAFIELSEGKGDCIVTTTIGANALIKELGITNLVVNGSEFTPFQVYFGSKSLSLINDINKALGMLISNGEYNDIYRKWFNQYEELYIPTRIYNIITFTMALVAILLIIFFIILFKRNDQRSLLKMLKNQQLNTKLALKSGRIALWRYNFAKQRFYMIEGSPLLGVDRTMRSNLEQLHPDDHQHQLQLFDKMHKGEVESATAIYRYINDNGSYNYYESSIKVIRSSSDGVINNIIGAKRDITNEIEAKEKAKYELNYLRMILNNLPIPIYITDYKTGLFTFANDKSEELFGIKVGMSATDFACDTTLHNSREIEKRLIETGEVYRGYEHLDYLDGRQFETYTHKCLINNDGHQQILSARIDETRAIENSRSLNILSAALIPLKAFYWTINVSGNVKVYSSLRHSVDINNIKTIDDLFKCIHINDRETILNEIEQQKASKVTTQNYVYRADITKEGEYEWWETTIMVNLLYDENKVESKEIFGFVRNVNQRELNNAKNRQLAKENELIINNVTTGLILIEPNYTVKWSNIVRRYGGLRGNKFVIGEKCYEGYGLSSPCEGCLLNKTLSDRTTYSYKNNKDPRYNLECTYIPIYDNDKPLAVLVKIEDRKEYNTLLSNLSIAKNKAEESDNLKSAFLANMSHEIRTPLNAIVGFSEIIVTEEDSIQREAYGNIISNNATLLINLINDILDLSKIEAGQFIFNKEWFDLDSVCTEIESIFRIQVKDGIQFNYIKPKQIVKVYSDESRFRQVLNNYLSNAIKYTESGTINFWYELIDGGIKIVVKDTGIGISKENIEKTFGRFMKFDSFAQGTGLGLAIVKALIDQVGGKVGVESEINIGSNFWLTIPCEVQNLSINNNANTLAQNKLEKKNEEFLILVAEDIDSNFQLLQALLKRYKLDRATNGKEAVEMCKSNNYDLIFMDINMPVMDGLEATRLIREFDKEITIIALTANAFDSDKTIALKSGCNDFVTKPISKDIINSIINKWYR